MKIFYNAHFLLTFTSLFWAFNTIAGRGAVGEVSPLLIVSVRWFFVALILTVICRPEFINSLFTLRKHFKCLIIMGLLGFTGFKRRKSKFLQENFNYCN